MFTPTGRCQNDSPQIQRLPFSNSLVSHLKQLHAAEIRMRQEAEFDAIEDRVWAMFGIEVEYCMDERIIRTS